MRNSPSFSKEAAVECFEPLGFENLISNFFLRRISASFYLASSILNILSSIFRLLSTLSQGGVYQTICLHVDQRREEIALSENLSPKLNSVSFGVLIGVKGRSPTVTFFEIRSKTGGLECSASLSSTTSLQSDFFISIQGFKSSSTTELFLLALLDTP